MKYCVKDRVMLRKILWLDAIVGGSTAIVGLLFYSSLTSILGLSTRFIIVVSGVTLLYAVVAFRLANQKTLSVPLLRLLVGANWLWTLVSIVLFFTHYGQATFPGITFLISQIVAVGGLAYLEGNQLVSGTMAGRDEDHTGNDL